VEKGSVLAGSLLSGLRASSLKRKPMSFTLKSLRGDQTLDLGSLGVRLLSLGLGCDLTTDDKLANVVLLGQSVKFANLGGTLGSQSFRLCDVGDAGDVALALLDDDDGEDGEVHADNATTNRLSLAFSSSARAVAGVAFRQEETNTGWVHDSLLHWETLLVVSSSDLENVAFELITDAISWNLLAHTLFHENAKFAVIFNLDELLGAVGRVGDVELHNYCVCEASQVHSVFERMRS